MCSKFRLVDNPFLGTIVETNIVQRSRPIRWNQINNFDCNLASTKQNKSGAKIFFRSQIRSFTLVKYSYSVQEIYALAKNKFQVEICFNDGAIFEKFCVYAHSTIYYLRMCWETS